MWKDDLMRKAVKIIFVMLIAVIISFVYIIIEFIQIDNTTNENNTRITTKKAEFYEKLYDRIDDMEKIVFYIRDIHNQQDKYLFIDDEISGVLSGCRKELNIIKRDLNIVSIEINEQRNRLVFKQTQRNDLLVQLVIIASVSDDGKISWRIEDISDIQDNVIVKLYNTLYN